MDAITLGLIGGISKSTAQQLVSVGIQSVVFVSPNTLKFTLANNSVQNVTIANFNEFTLELKNKLISLDDVLLNKFSVVGSDLLFNGQPINETIDLSLYLKTIDADSKYELKNSAIVKDSSYVHTDNNYTNADKLVISNTSGINTGDETETTIKNKLKSASTSQDGYLTSVDWNTFNNKQNKIFIQETQPSIATDNIWVDNTTNPYTLKVCDGTSYVQVGNSAGGSVQEIVIQNTQPSDTAIKLWLDTSTNPILKWYNGSLWINVGSSSGHIIKDSTQAFTQRNNLKFTGNVSVSDDSISDSTVINFGNTIANATEPKEDIALIDGQDTYEVINHTVGTKYMFILVDGVRIPYADYDDIDSTHIKLKPNVAIDVKKDMVITSFTTVIEQVLVNDTTLNGGTF